MKLNTALLSLFLIVSIVISLPLKGEGLGEGAPLRMLNHWDNPDGTVERGYAGHSIFWSKDGVADLDVIRAYGEYNKEIGINATVLNNVNAKPEMLSAKKLRETKRIADALRPYGIRVFLAVNFASPKALGDVPTADPLDKRVQQWWAKKVKEIYKLIPDFGGFLVKANSEGEPGPMDYGRTHVDGANMLADALAGKGVVIWRAFVYSAKGGDRASQAYDEFMPFDGQFRDNVIIQIKVGPVDFQPTEPASPLLYALKHTKMMLEVQLTQEYTGESIHTCFMPNYTFDGIERLISLTNSLPSEADGRAGVGLEGTNGGLVGIAGVSNVGNGINTNGEKLPSVTFSLPSEANGRAGEGLALSCGSVMAEANWYAFGRLAQYFFPDENNLGNLENIESLESLESLGSLKSLGSLGNLGSLEPLEFLKTAIAREWLSRTFSFDPRFVEPMTRVLLQSHKAVVNYMMPLGLHHIFAGGHHYGPEPWCDPKGWREDWKPKYYHKAAADGIGFDRTVATGSGNTALYPDSLARLFEDPSTCPEEYLLWFHHLSWNYRMHSGETLWEALCHHYDQGVREAEAFAATWRDMKPYVDPTVHAAQQLNFDRQARDAWWWRDACLLYFQQFSKLPLPIDSPAPRHNLAEMMRYHLNIDNYTRAPFSMLPE